MKKMFLFGISFVLLAIVLSGCQSTAGQATKPAGCFDSDGGKEIGVKGQVSLGKQKINDACTGKMSIALTAENSGKTATNLCHISGYEKAVGAKLCNGSYLRFPEKYSHPNCKKGAKTYQDCFAFVPCGNKDGVSFKAVMCENTEKENVEEYYCNDKNQIESAEFQCAGGCENGACVPQLSKCNELLGKFVASYGKVCTEEGYVAEANMDSNAELVSAVNNIDYYRFLEKKAMNHGAATS